MGQRLYQVAFLVSAFWLSSAAFAAYKIGIYTDQPSQDKSKGLVEYLKNNPPFNKFDVEFVIYPMSTQELNCGPSNGIARLVTCDTQKVQNAAFKNGVDQAFVVSNYPAYLIGLLSFTRLWISFTVSTDCPVGILSLR